MMSDEQIKFALDVGQIKIEGFDDLYVGPSSVDLHLDNKAKIMQQSMLPINISEDLPQDLFQNYNGWDDITIHPGMFYLLSTKEKITLADDIGCFVEGRSSIGRLGLHVQSAGYVDLGFSGTITLEVSNLSPNRIILPLDTRICQLVFFRSNKPATVPYHKKKDAKYMNQMGPTITKKDL